MKAWRIVLYSLCVAPLVFSIGLTAFYFHAWSVVGHAPVYGQPDPKTIAIYDVYAYVTYGSLFVAGYSFFASLVVLPLYLIFNRKQLYWPPVILWGGSYALAFCVMKTPMLEWFLD